MSLEFLSLQKVNRKHSRGKVLENSSRFLIIDKILEKGAVGKPYSCFRCFLSDSLFQILQIRPARL